MPTKAGIMKLRSVRKSKLFLFLFVLIISISLLSTGCGPGRPSAYSVDNPTMIPDGSGGIIVAYQINKGDDMTTYLQRLGADGTAQWDNPGIVLPKGGGGFAHTRNARLISDKQGNYIVIFYQSDGLWAQKLDSDGHFLWPDDGIRLTSDPAYQIKAISDGTGGAIIMWADSDSWEGDNIFLQRVDDNGNLLWDADIPMAFGRYGNIDSDSSGGTLMIWEENHTNVFTQRFGASGEPLWGEGLLLTDDVNQYSKFDIISDGNGGAVAVWEQNSHLYTQVIDATGEMDSERRATIASLYSPRIISDGSTGYLVFGTHSHAIYVLRLDAAGSVVSLRRKIVDSNERLTYEVIADGSGGAVIVFWNGVITGVPQYLHAQRLDATFELLWGEDGIRVSYAFSYWAGYKTAARISLDGEGGFFISWAAGSSIRGKTSSYIQHIDADGNLLWGKSRIGNLLWGKSGIRLNP